MAFYVIARNRDDHTKNIAFLMNRKGEWKLSQAYDVKFAYDPANKWMKAHQLSINGKNDAIELKDLLTVAKEMIRSLNITCITLATRLTKTKKDTYGLWVETMMLLRHRIIELDLLKWKAY